MSVWSKIVPFYGVIESIVETEASDVVMGA